MFLTINVVYDMIKKKKGIAKEKGEENFERVGNDSEQLL